MRKNQVKALRQAVRMCLYLACNIWWQGSKWVKRTWTGVELRSEGLQEVALQLSLED